MILSDLIADVRTKYITAIHGDLDCDITSLCIDSRQCSPNSLFFAVRGTVGDGHNHIDDAVERGANAIVCEELPESTSENVTYLVVGQTIAVVGHIASSFYDHPSRELKVVGITGTNGKTTTATLLYQLLTHLGHKVGLLATHGHFINGQEFPKDDGAPTTVHAIEHHMRLREMIDAGCSHAIVEVSSHGVMQHRIAGIDFNGAIFTNITQDHINYHDTFEQYLAAKQAFFDHLPDGAWALANADDGNGEFMLQNTHANKYYYAIQAESDFNCDIVSNNIDGIEIAVNKGKSTPTQLIGAYNAYNLTATYGAAYLLDETDEDILAQMHKLTPPPGRFQIVTGPKDIIGIVDYAHTPDAVDSVLQTINDVLPDNRQVITIIGAGGDRDKTKRPMMGSIAYAHSHILILTSDNPRSEEPLEIIYDMKQGITHPDEKRLFEIPDRSDAIEAAVETAQPGDVIMVLGKGHEDYQEINGEKKHFDDVEELEKAFADLVV